MSDWTGIHPHRWAFGWIVTQQPGSFRRGFRRLTRGGAERLARRLNQRRDRHQREKAEAGLKTFHDPWYVIGRIQDHPQRSRSEHVR